MSCNIVSKGIMMRFIFYAMCLILFFVHFKSFCNENGYLWIPLSWTFFYDSSKSDISELKFKSIKMVFHEENTNKIIYSDVILPKDKKNFYLFNKSSNTKTFFSKKFIIMPEGKYIFDGIISEINGKNNNIEKVNFGIKNIFVKNEQNGINFKISKDKISIFPAMSVETDFNFNNNKFYHLTKVDLIEEESVSINEIQPQLVLFKKMYRLKKISFMNGNDIFPPLQVTVGSSVNINKSNFLGLIIDVPCDIYGSLKFVWVNQDDIFQHSFNVKLNKNIEVCNIFHSVPVKFYLPNGKWTLQYMTLNIPNKMNRDFLTDSLINKNKEIKKYFKLSNSYFNDLNIKERALSKNIVLNLNEKKELNRFYFIGTAEIRRSLENGNNKDTLKFYFKRNYEIFFIRKLFSVKKIYNAFTLEPLKKDRSIGDIQLKIDLIGNTSTQKKYALNLNEFRKFVTSNLSQCVSEQEVEDPLLTLNGSIKIRNFANKTEYLDVSRKDFNFAQNGISQNKIIDCMEIQLRSFKFSRPFRAKFQANILFESL